MPLLSPWLYEAVDQPGQLVGFALDDSNTASVIALAVNDLETPNLFILHQKMSKDGNHEEKTNLLGSPAAVQVLHEAEIPQPLSLAKLFTDFLNNKALGCTSVG